MNSIYHVTFSSITDYLGYGLQIETCLSNNIDVKILDISKLFNFPTPSHSPKYNHLVMQINTYKEFYRLISSTSPNNVIFNIQITYEWRFIKIFRLIAKMKNYNFSIFLLGQLPFHTQLPLWKKIFTTSIVKVPYKVITQVFSRLLFKTHFLKLQNILFYAGESLAETSGKDYKFPINFFDYDKYLENQVTRNDGYAVFLDDGYFRHPDDEIVGNVITEDLKTSYQNSLNNFFNFVENTMKIKVIVSPHPKVSYPDNFFENRTILINKSRELVQNARLILCHSSSSISYAVCYDKPIYFLTDKNIINFSKKYQPFNQYIYNFAKHLDRPVINLSEPLKEWNTSSEVINQNAYDKFKMNYLTTKKTKNILTKDIIVKDLMEIFKN